VFYDKRDLAQYRPLALKNKVSSVLAEIVKVRMRPHLPRTTLPDQCAAAPGRYMFEAIFKILDGMHLADEYQLPMACLMADARKAYDLLGRGYLRAALLIICGHEPDDPHCETNAAGQRSPQVVSCDG
jgi:hypothetical protein